MASPTWARRTAVDRANNIVNVDTVAVPGALLFIRQDSAYRLTWRLVPPPGPPPIGPRAPLPLETTFTHSASLSLKYEVSLAVRSASRLLCSVPEAAVVNPGSWKITHEPLSSSVTERFTFGLSVAT